MIKQCKLLQTYGLIMFGVPQGFSFRYLNISITRTTFLLVFFNSPYRSSEKLKLDSNVSHEELLNRNIDLLPNNIDMMTFRQNILDFSLINKTLYENCHRTLLILNTYFNSEMTKWKALCSFKNVELPYLYNFLTFDLWLYCSFTFNNYLSISEIIVHRTWIILTTMYQYIVLCRQKCKNCIFIRPISKVVVE